VMVRDWDDKGRIVLVTTYGQPFFRNYRAFTLDPAGGLPELISLGQVNHIAWQGKRCVIGRNTADPARWKRYRGGTAGHLWVDATGSGAFVRLDDLQGNISSPMWIGERIYFLSDMDGVGNLYSCTAEGQGVERHTDHGSFYARHAQSDGSRIVYQCAGEVWIFDSATGASEKIAIETPANRQQLARKFVPTSQNLTSIHLNPSGERIALEVRGQIHAGGLWEGAMRPIAPQDGVRQRLGQWLGDGKSQVLISDASGEERLEWHRADGVTAFDWDIGRVLSLVVAPAGERVALSNHRNQVYIADLATRKLILVDESRDGRSDDLAFSPDGEWLAYNFWANPRASAIKLFGLATGTATFVTEPEFRDYAPCFDPRGKFLYFLSMRTFDPVYDSVQFELSFPRATRPYLVALHADSENPFEPAPHHLKSKADEVKEELVAGPVKVRIDLDGLARRVAAFPIAEGLFGTLLAAPKKVFYTELGIAASHGRGGHKELPTKLKAFDFDAQASETWFERCDAVALSGDCSTLAVRIKDRVRVAAVSQGPSREDDNKDDRPSRKSGWIDLDRVRVSVTPLAEWRQMFFEVWRLQRDQFWVEDMSSTDWNAVREQYRPLLDKIATRSDLSDLIWEMQGELGTSHAYESGGDHRRPPSWTLGQLAAEFSLKPESGAAVITEIVAGDAWEDNADSPLNALGVNLQVGDAIVAVNGHPVDFQHPPQSYLVHQAGLRVDLDVKAKGGALRTVAVKVLTDDTPARYRQWVEANRRWVHEHSAGQVGYLHLPDMMSAGFAEFHRYFINECDRAALIIDVRYNRGGHVSQLLLEKIARRRIAYDWPRWASPVPYPVESPAGPLVALTNEHAGSDGDIFSHCFKLMGLGPLVGKRTWGGVIGIHPRHALVDGSETTQPEFSFWFEDVGWGVENFGTLPDVDVDNLPQDAREGRDRQLEAALDAARVRIAEAGKKPPHFGDRPNLARPALSPRKGR
jgi:tricorn protease